jgi:hypothetical protein
MQRVELRIRIPLVFSCMTDGCNELTKVGYCESCIDDLLKPPVHRKQKNEHKPSELKIRTTLREGFVSVERRSSPHYLSG